MDRANPIERLLAGTVDAVLLLCAALGMLFAAIASGSWHIAVFFVLMCIAAAFPVLYYAKFLSGKWQGTIGMRILRLRVLNDDMTKVSLRRGIQRTLLMLACLGPITVVLSILDDDFRTPYDKFTRTSVFRDKTSWLGGVMGQKNVTITNTFTDSPGAQAVVGKHIGLVHQNVAVAELNSGDKRELQILLKDLTACISTLAASKDSRYTEHVETMEDALETLVNEIKAEKPKKSKVRISLAGIKEAAEVVGASAVPILKTATALSNFLSKLT